MTTLQINGSETDTLRLFLLDLPPEAVERYTTMAGTGEYPLKYGLGATKLRPGFVDVIDIRDLEGMPLSSYLQQAHGVSDAALAGDRARLDALKGTVIALPAQAFENTTQTLTVQTPLRHLGTYAETKPAGRSAPIKTKSARGLSSAGPARMGKGGSATLKLIVAVLAVIIVAVLVMVLG